MRTRAMIVATGLLALALPGASPAATQTAPHLAGEASAALLVTPPADPAAAGGPAAPFPTNPRQVATTARASTTGFDGDPATSRSSAAVPGATAERRAGDGDGPATAGLGAGPFASATARPVDAATGICPDPEADGARTIADGLARSGPGTAVGPVTLSGAARSTMALVPVGGQDALGVRSVASTDIATVTVGALELRVLSQPRLVAQAAGRDGQASITWDAPVIDVVDRASGATLARLDEDRLSYRTPDESEFGGREQPLRISLVSPYEQITSPDGGFARARAALVRIRLRPNYELGELTVGALTAAATAPVGGVSTCDGGTPLPQVRRRPHVLVYEGNRGFEHNSRREANRVLGRLAQQTDAFSLEITDQATFLRDDRLAGADMVLFNNNVGVMPVDGFQKDALERYLLDGGGAGGIHSATDANYDWPEYGELFGARFDGHPHMGYMQSWGKARLVVENRQSPITRPWHGQEAFWWADEYYRWRPQDIELLRRSPDVDVLLSLDTNTVHPGTQQGLNPYGPYRVRFQPVAWTKTFRGAGRVFYTNMGHNGFGWADEGFRTMVLEGIRWVTDGTRRARCAAARCAPGPRALPPVPLSR